MTTAYERFDTRLSVVSQAINTASAALSHSKICDLEPLGELIDELCHAARAVVDNGDDDERERVGDALEAITVRMDHLEVRLRVLIAEGADDSKDNAS